MYSTAASSDPTATLLLVNRSSSETQSLRETLESALEIRADERMIATSDDWDITLAAQMWDLVLCDFELLLPNATHALARIQAAQPRAVLIVVSQSGTIRDAVEMMRLGAQGFVEWTDREHLIALVRQELAARRLTARSSDAQIAKAHYQNIVDEQTELICRYDKDFRLTFVNRAYSLWQGQPAEALLGTIFIDKIPAPDRAQALSKVRTLSVEQPATTSVHPSILPDGTECIIEWTDSAVFDTSGRIMEYQGVGRDITKRIQAERAAQRLAQRIEGLHRLDQAMLTADSLETLAKVALDHIIGLFPCDRVSIGRYDAKTKTLQLLAVHSEQPSDIDPHGIYPVMPAYLSALENDKWVLLRDTTPTANPNLQTLFREGIRSILLVGLYSENRLIGMLNFHSVAPEYFTDEHRYIALEVADQLAIGMHKAALVDELARYAQRMEILHAIDLGLIQGGSIKTLIASTLQNLQRVIPCERIGLGLIDQSRQEIVIYTSNFDYPSELLEGTRIPIPPNWMRMFDAEGARIVNNLHVADEPPFKQLAKEGFQSHLQVLLRGQAASIGVLGFSSRTLDFFTLEHQDVAVEVGSQFAVALHQMHLSEALGRYVRRLEILHDIDRGLLQGGPIQHVIEGALKNIRTLIPCQRATVGVFDSNLQEGLLFAVDLTGETALIQGTRVPIRPSTFEGLDSRHMKIIDDIRPLSSVHPEAKKLADEGLVSGLQVLLLEQDRPIGLLGLLADTPGFFTADYQEIALEISRQLALGVHQKQLADELARSYAELEQRVMARTAELQATNDRLTAILNNSRDGILLVDRDLTIVQSNPAFEQLLLDASPELPGENLLNYLDTAAVARVRAGVEKAITDQRSTQMEVSVKRPDGVNVDVVLGIGSIPGDGLVAAVHDITERKRVEADLAESEARYRLLAENIEDIIMTFSMDRRITYFSPSCQKLLGYLPEEVVGRTHSEFIHPDDYPQVVDRTRDAVVAGKNAYTSSFRLRHKAGHYIWYEVHTRIMRDPETGKVFNFVSVLRDITQRKQAEDALRESESRYRLLAENATDLVIRQDLDGKYLYVSPSSRMVVGYAPEEMVGRNGLDDIHPDDRSNLLQIVSIISEQHPPAAQLMFRFRHKDGHYIWLESSGQVIFSPDSGQPMELVSSARDVTVRKEAEEALHVSEERLRTIVENIPVMISFFDQVGRFEYVNQAWLDQVGWTIEDLSTAEHSLALFYPDLQYRQQVLEYMFSPGSEWRDFNSQTKHRGERVTSWANVRLSDGRSIGIGQDVTERKQAEEALKRALQEEKELSELKSRFVSIASHEFRTPLAAILAASETLLKYRDRMDNAQIDARLGRIRQQVEHLNGIVEDILQLARIQSGRLEFKPVPGDVSALCREIVDDFEGQTLHRGRIVYTALGAPIRMTYDARLMRQTIINLVSNALKYSPEDSQVQLTLSVDGAQVLMTVEDRGIGIPTEDLKHLFEPFHRAGNVGNISGTGLGLSITKQAVELHGGTLNVESYLGTGTTFTIRIPIHGA